MDNQHIYENDDESSLSSYDDYDEDSCYEPWIKLFVSSEGNDLLCEVDENYIRDDFNLIGLKQEVQYYDLALDVILDENSETQLSTDLQGVIEVSAERLYGLIHARYILTQDGLNAMHQKYRHNAFGICPRYFCEKQQLLPLGLSDRVGVKLVKMYCPRCRELYFTPHGEYLDGAYFGTSFAHLFTMIYLPNIAPVTSVYIPRIFGFRIHGVSSILDSPEEKEALVARREQIAASGPRQFTVHLSKDANGKIIGRDGRVLMSSGDFFDESDGEVRGSSSQSNAQASNYNVNSLNGAFQQMTVNGSM